MRLNRVVLTLICAGALTGRVPTAAAEPVAIAENSGGKQKLDNATIERLLRL